MLPAGHAHEACQVLKVLFNSEWETNAKSRDNTGMSPWTSLHCRNISDLHPRTLLGLDMVQALAFTVEDLEILQYDAPPKEALTIPVPHILEHLFSMWELPVSVPIVSKWLDPMY